MSDINRIAVVGAGMVGKQLALVLLENGFQVCLVTRRGNRGYDDFITFYKTELNKHRTSPGLLDKLCWREDLHFNSGRRLDLVIETREEDIEVKKSLFRDLDRFTDPRTILASNTSSLSITDIVHDMEFRRRVLGLHFFNPIRIMKLVEIIRIENTDDEVVEAAEKFVRKLGKTPIVIPDIPGHIVNRLLFLMINQAIKLMDEYAIEAEKIDQAMKLGANHPIGPLALADLIGLDVCLKILESLKARTYDESYYPSQLLRSLVSNGRLGRKSGKGFYEYVS